MALTDEQIRDLKLLEIETKLKAIQTLIEMQSLTQKLIAESFENFKRMAAT